MTKKYIKPRGYWNNKNNCAKVAALCSSRYEFSKKYSSAYNSSLRNGWIEDICKHMSGRSIPCDYWNKERCRLEALKYSNRSEFSKQSNGAYTTALKNGWLDEICKHMIIKWQRKWDKESCRREAIKYTTRTEFQNNSHGAWAAANKKGWLDEICKHMTVKWQHKWDKESCRKEALKYTSRTDFENNSSGAWAAANKKGWLDEICLHMEVLGNLFQRCIYAFEFSDNYVYVGLTDNFKRREKQHLNQIKSPVYQHIQETQIKPTAKILNEYTDRTLAQKLEKFYLDDYFKKGWNILNSAKPGALGGKYIYWTKERCIEAGKKCRTKSEFIKFYNGAYASSLKNGWYDEVSAHMISPIAKPQKWDFNKVQTEALKYSTRNEFALKCYPAYNYARKNKILNKVCSHMVHPTPLRKWTLEALKKEAKKYNSRSEFQSKNSSAYSIAAKENLLDEICVHMNPLREAPNYWTKEKCQERALLYKTKSDFKKHDGSAYTTAVREKWLNEICTHMTKPQIKRKWTIEKLYAEAKKYKTIKEFKMKSHSAYVTAQNLGIGRQICSHMYKGKRKLRALEEIKQQKLSKSFEDNLQLSFNIDKIEI